MPGAISEPMRERRRRRGRPSLVCLGDLMLDIVVRSETAVDAGTDVPGSVRFRAGGSAANTARAFAALGGKAALVGAIGDDVVGGRLTASLRASGVDVHAVKLPGRTGRLLALVGPTGERSFVTDRGVADALAPGALRQRWLAADALHLPAYSLLAAPMSDSALLAAGRARSRGALVSVDLASRRPLLADGRRAARALIARAAPNVIFANEQESDALVGRDRAERLVELAPVAVVKLGAAGCRVLWRAAGAGSAVEHALVATKPVTGSDTTGAGDAFDAGFLFALLAAGHRAGAPIGGPQLRRAALAGHEAALRTMRGPRPELAL